MYFSFAGVFGILRNQSFRIFFPFEYQVAAACYDIFLSERGRRSNRLKNLKLVTAKSFV